MDNEIHVIRIFLVILHTIYRLIQSCSPNDDQILSYHVSDPALAVLPNLTHVTDRSIELTSLIDPGVVIIW